MKITKSIVFALLFTTIFSFCAQHTFASTSDNLVWSTKTSMPTAKYNFQAVGASNGNIYAIGGHDATVPNGVIIGTVEEYDPSTDTWTTKTNMPTARQGFGMAIATNGKIYAIGGQYAASSGSGILDTVEEYDPSTDTWTTKTSMPTPRVYLGLSASSNGKIYAMGGTLTNGSSTDIVEEYDPSTDTWSTKTSMPTVRSGLGAVEGSNGKIYAVGGNTGSGISSANVVEEYNPSTNSWASRSNMPTPRVGFGIINAANGKIYAYGGECPTYTICSSVEEYNLVNNTWRSVAGMSFARSYFGAVATNNKIYAIGGLEFDFSNFPNLIPSATVE